MGMPIQNLHDPSVGSSASTAPFDNASLTDLIARKDALESELKALGSVLDSHNVHMRTTLTTFDGYPRSDIDIAQIRTTRARIIHLRNDHKALLARIEEGLHAHFAAAEKEEEDRVAYSPVHGTGNGTTNGTTHSNGTSNGVGGSNSTNSTSTKPAFAIVNTVAPSSPASGAGMRVGDRIVQFGEVDWLNHEKLARVAQVVGRSEGRGIEVVVSREREGGEVEVKKLRLVPRRDWGGRGTLGCHLKEV